MMYPKIIKKLLRSLLLMLLVVPCFVGAAEIRIDTDKTTASIGEEVTASILVHSEESINAIEGKVLFPQDDLEMTGFSDGNSVINLWIEKPHLESSGVIAFSGITPGGFKGANQIIFSIVFRPKNTGAAIIDLTHTKILLNDGLGTPLAHGTHSSSIQAIAEDSTFKKSTIEDLEPPEDFTPLVTRNENLFSGEYMLIFSTQDKKSGIERYQVREGSWGFFKNASSPYRLTHQDRDKTIYIKAIDRAGNERMVLLPPEHPSSEWKGYGIFAIVLLICILFIRYF